MDDPSNPFSTTRFVKHMVNSTDLTEIDNIMRSGSLQRHYMTNLNTRARLRDSKWDEVAANTDGSIFLEHVYNVSTTDNTSTPVWPTDGLFVNVQNATANGAVQVKLGDIFRPVFTHTIAVDRSDFLDDMLNLNKPCPLYDENVFLFGRIRKTQEVVSHNTDHECSQCNEHGHEKTKSNFRNDMKSGLTDFKYVTESTNSTFNSRYYDQFVLKQVKEYFKNPKVVGDKLFGKAADETESEFNRVYKSYPHPYSLAFTYSEANDTDLDGTYQYKGMLPNSVSPQWGACVAANFTDHGKKLVCLGGMMCYNSFKRNAGLHHSTYSSRRGDALLCDNMDDAPHNVAISPRNYNYGSHNDWNGEWDTSVISNCNGAPSSSFECILFDLQLPIGLLGHTALVINGKIRVFGGMYSKLSSFKGYKFSRSNRDGGNVIDRYLHDSVAQFTLVYDVANAGSGWERGKHMMHRRFGHTSVYYNQYVYHIGGGQSVDDSCNGAERWNMIDDDQGQAEPKKQQTKTIIEGKLKFH